MIASTDSRSMTSPATTLSRVGGRQDSRVGGEGRLTQSKLLRSPRFHADAKASSFRSARLTRARSLAI
jgi:hypothetical protein